MYIVFVSTYTQRMQTQHVYVLSICVSVCACVRVWVCKCLRIYYMCVVHIDYHLKDDNNVLNCSISGHRAVGSFNLFYAASKFAVTALTEGLRKELRELKSNIKITVSEQ